MKDLFCEFYNSSGESMKADFEAGAHYRFPGGGYTNRFMLTPGEYRLANYDWSGGQCVVRVTYQDHLDALQAIIDLAGPHVTDREICEKSFRRFCNLCDMRLLYVNRRRMTPGELFDLVSRLANIAAGNIS